MNVKNRKCIRKLSLKSLYANRRRNLIAIFAIALTTLLFTSMFTIVLSLNASYETYQFRQVGGYAHGTFKDVSPEQAERIAAHPKVKAAGVRKVIGITAEGVFAKIPAEISYMDANCTKWSYATPTTGRMPESGKEVAMDTAALQLLGVTPELGAEVTVSYSITDKDQTAFTVTDTFTLVGYWDYDELMPVHYINISRDYADDIEAQAVKTGLQPFRTDLNVMMASSTNIQGQMEQVDTDLGYTWDSYTDPNSVRIGVNWGYTSSQLESQLDPELVIAIAAFLLLVIFTGYLIIYNIFQISVAGDIRFYGLLKTIGTTPRQLKRIIRQQALLLCNFLWSGACSLFVLAGSLQFLMVTFFAGGVSLATVAVLALLLNSRHIFYGLSFIDKFRSFGPWRWFLIYSLCDENYSLHCSHDFGPDVNEKWAYVLTAAFVTFYWVALSMLGGLVGALIPFDTTVSRYNAD